MENKPKKIKAQIFLAAIISVEVLLGILTLIGMVGLVATGNLIYSAMIMIFGIATVVGFFTLLGIYIGNYNKLVKLKNKTEQSLSLIDVYLKLRFDLIPNLVETVKGYIKHEKDVLKTVVELRNIGLATDEEASKIDVANRIVPEMKKILILAEDYPELKANKLFLNLTKDLTQVEEKIAAARRFYNSNINAYNNLVQTFPSNMVALLFGFEKMQMFTIDVNERVVSKVNLELI